MTCVSNQNRLIEAQAAGTSVTLVRYAYDAQSRRIAETVGSATTIYVYDGWNPIAEYNTTYALTKTYIWGMDLSGSMQGAGGVGGLLSVTDGTGTYFPTFDGNGNVSEYLDSTGNIVAHYEYDPFGKTTVATGSKANDFSHRFSTKPLNLTTGLYYYGYRFYDPETGRWPSRDPIGEEGGLNLYGFVENQPVNRIDYLGNSSVDLSSKIKDFLLPRAQVGWDGSILIAKPFIAPIGAFFQIHLYATLVAKPCCDKAEGDIDLMWEARGGVEAFLQWGHTFKWNNRNHGQIQPNQGYRDRSWHADFRARTEDCPNSAFEVADWSIVAFLRGSTGVGVGIQGAVEFTIAQNNFDPDSLWDRFNANGSVAWGVVGASVELGIGGSVGFKGKVELP